MVNGTMDDSCRFAHCADQCITLSSCKSSCMPDRPVATIISDPRIASNGIYNKTEADQSGRTRGALGFLQRTLLFCAVCLFCRCCFKSSGLLLKAFAEQHFTAVVFIRKFAVPATLGPICLRAMQLRFRHRPLGCMTLPNQTWRQVSLPRLRIMTVSECGVVGGDVCEKMDGRS